MSLGIDVPRLDRMLCRAPMYGHTLGTAPAVCVTNTTAKRIHHMTKTNALFRAHSAENIFYSYIVWGSTAWNCDMGSKALHTVYRWAGAAVPSSQDNTETETYSAVKSHPEGITQCDLSLPNGEICVGACLCITVMSFYELLGVFREELWLCIVALATSHPHPRRTCMPNCR